MYEYGNSNDQYEGSQYGSYQSSGSAYSSTGNYQTGGADGNGRKKKSGSGIGKKIVLALCCGLIFGICAGIGFEAVNTAGGLIKAAAGIEDGNDNQQIAQTPDRQEEASEKVQEEKTKQEPSGEIKEADTADVGQAQESAVLQTTVTDVTKVVEDVMPAMVSVNNKYVERMSFFGQEYSKEEEGAGSGIIVGQNETELLLVSNYHVVKQAEELTVLFVDGTQALAQLKGSDADKDLAVMAVQLSDISQDTKNKIAIARLGDSNQLTIGESVIAIGNAMGYGQSVTTGVVSALNRPIGVSDYEQADGEVNTFIQTDAAINPGNSGGALLNTRGEVIGINSNKIGGNIVEGMGYAIPISDAKPIIENLMTKEIRVKAEDSQKGYLGITGADVIAESAEIYGMPQGVYVTSVLEGGAAYQAGVNKGDIITALNGTEIQSMAELKEELSYYSAGETIELTIMCLPQENPAFGAYMEKQVSVTLGLQTS